MKLKIKSSIFNLLLILVTSTALLLPFQAASAASLSTTTNPLTISMQALPSPARGFGCDALCAAAWFCCRVGTTVGHRHHPASCNCNGDSADRNIPSSACGWTAHRFPIALGYSWLSIQCSTGWEAAAFRFVCDQPDRNR